MSFQGQAVQVERPSMLDSIGGIPIRWFQEIDAACDAFFARRGIRYEKCYWREDIRADMHVAKARKAGKE